MSRLVIILCVIPFVTALSARSMEPDRGDPQQARIVTDDLDHFWEAWDVAAEAVETEDRIQAFARYYHDVASPGLQDFFKLRINDVSSLVNVIDAAPNYYASLRQRMALADEMAEPARDAFLELETRYPAAVFPDVYIVIGRFNAGGTVGSSGLLIGAEFYGKHPDAPLHELPEPKRNVLRSLEELPHIIAHELIHFQQPQPQGRVTLLDMAYREGSADFVAELISGQHINHHVHEWALPREAKIWRRFSDVMESQELHGFLYGQSERPEGWPADVGYFVGYRIAQAYYEQADDKDQALADIITAVDIRSLLERSGYSRRFDN